MREKAACAKWTENGFEVDGAKKSVLSRPIRPRKLKLVSEFTLKNKHEVNALTLYVHVASTLRPLARSGNCQNYLIKITVKILRPLRPHVSKSIAVFG